MASPLVPQGSLNRLRPSLVIPGFPALNVTAPYLGKASIRITYEGDAVTYIASLTGAVTSPEPFQLISMRVNLLKTQALAQAYKTQMETNALLGDITLRSDSIALSVWPLVNCSISSVPELNFDGNDADYNVVIKGVYYINSSLFNA